MSYNTVAVSCDIPEDVSSVCSKAAMFGDRIKDTPVFEHYNVSNFILFYYLDQQMHAILTVMSISKSNPMCFDAFTSSSGSIFFYS